ncbi:MAG: 50S ribosomal protein L21e [Candidatus Micrarchaeota archaeon]
MTKRSVGKLSKRSRLLRTRNRTRTTISRIIREFKDGDTVSIDLKSGHSGMPHPRYRGLTGVVVGKQGSACLVVVKVGNAEKTLIIPPVHLR